MAIKLKQVWTWTQNTFYLFMISGDSTVTSLSIFVARLQFMQDAKKPVVAPTFHSHWLPLSGLDLITFLIVCRALCVRALTYSMMLICDCTSPLNVAGSREKTSNKRPLCFWPLVTEPVTVRLKLDDSVVWRICLKK